MKSLLSLVVSSLLVAACAATADDGDSSSADVKRTHGGDPEATAAAKLESLRGDDDALLAFITKMPKGGDLHQHLSGGIYAESFIAWGTADGACYATSNWDSFEKPECRTTDQSFPASGTTAYTNIIDQWSMQDFVPSAAQSGHDHFFAAFGRYGAISAWHGPDMIAEVATRAAADNEQYLELMLGLASTATGKVVDAVWGTPATELTQAGFADYHQKLLAASGWTAALASASTTLDKDEAAVKTSLGCSTSTPQPGCGVELRYLYQADRAGQPHEVFAEFVAAFEMAKTEKRVVGMNFVGPEDGTVSLRDYALHMQMLDYLHTYYAGTSPLHVALHAGEITAAVLPAGDTTDLQSHIRQAVEIGHAERIGHGVDIAGEEDSAGLIAEMAQKNILVESCLTSNAEILVVSGTAHPLATYRAAGVPVTLGTDDPGVARSSMSKEYLRGATDQKLGYLDLKSMARQSIEHSFLPGDSLWTSIGTKATNAACTSDTLGAAKPSAACATFLAGSERATQQWALEARFTTFETSL